VLFLAVETLSLSPGNSLKVHLALDGGFVVELVLNWKRHE
jgi:hypothetical protein